MKILTLTLLCIVACALPARGDRVFLDSERYNPYHASAPFAQAREYYLGEEDYEPDSLASLLSEELALHPDNGYARVMLMLEKADRLASRYKNEISDESGNDSLIRERYDAALLGMIDEVDKGASQIPAADAENRSSALLMKAVMYLELGFGDSQEERILKNIPQIEAALKQSVDILPGELNLPILLKIYAHVHPETFQADMARYIDLFYIASPGNEDAVTYKLEQLMSSGGDDEQIIEVVDRYRSAAPTEEVSTSILTAKAHALINLGRDEEAFDLLLDMLEQQPSVGDSPIAQQIVNIARRDPEMAKIKLGQRKFASPGENQRLYLADGLVDYYGFGDYDGAIANYKRAILKENPRLMLHRLALTYMLKGDTENALLYAAACDAAAPSVTSYSYRQFLLMLMGRYDENIAWFKQRNDLLKSGETALLAELHVMNHDYLSAAELFPQALEQTDGSGDVRYNYGMALMKLGRKGEARQELRNVLSSSFGGDLADSLRYTASAHLALGNKKAALPLIEQFAAMHGSSGDGGSQVDAYQVATLYALAGDKTRALKYLEEHFLKDDEPFNFGQIEKNIAFDGIRSTKEYKALVEKYHAMWKDGKLPPR